jgi:hypothetical protein
MYNPELIANVKKPSLILFVASSLFDIFMNSGRRRRLAIALIILKRNHPTHCGRMSPY